MKHLFYLVYLNDQHLQLISCWKHCQYNVGNITFESVSLLTIVTALTVESIFNLALQLHFYWRGGGKREWCKGLNGVGF